MTENFRFIRVPLLVALMGLLASLMAPSQAATWYVRPDVDGSGTGWGDALGSFQAAINSASAGDEIWGASGVYNESLRLKAGIALYGGFAAVETVREDRNFAANPTILDAMGLNQRVVTADGTEGVTIDGFTIRNGNSPASGGGIYFNNVSSATVSNCNIRKNSLVGASNLQGAGVYCSSSSLTLTNCTISGNTATGTFSDGGGVYCLSSSPTLTYCTISDNSVKRNGGGLHCIESSSPVLNHCTISDNTAFPGSGGGLFCTDNSSPTLTDCTISGNSTLYGGGLYCSFSSPTLTHCTITNNFAASDGGGAACRSASPTMIHCTISRNTSNLGYGGGVACFHSSSPTLTHCIIFDNQARLVEGGGVYCSSSSPSIVHCTISDNFSASHGGGVACSDNSSPTIAHCTISDNITWDHGGGVYCDRSSPTLSNCAITGNTAAGFSRGGGVYCSSNSSPTLTHCTVTGNKANRDGDGVASLSSSSPTFINSILWNGGDEVFLNSATAEVTFSAIQGGYPGQGNIDEDPMFVDPEQSAYRLSMGSPCIDSGSNGAVLRLGPSVLALGDLDGRMRIWDGDSDGFAVVDMGAYEFGPPPFVGDVFEDARVNHLDLFRFQQVWKEEGEGVLPEADQDGDKTIGAADLVILLHAWGNVTGP